MCLWLQLSSIHSACAILSSVTCPAVPYFFSTLSHKRHDYQKKKPLLNIKFVVFFFTVVPCILILSKFLHQLMHKFFKRSINPFNAELNPICHLLALLGARPIFHVGRIRVKIYIKTGPTCFGVITIIRERTI